MANESSFTSEVIFFHKRLSNTPENVRKFIKILDVFLELTNTYYGGFQEVTTDDMEFNEQADYVESISYYFFSCGRWTYENSFNYINKLCKEGFERELNNIKENFPDCYNDISYYMNLEKDNTIVFEPFREDNIIPVFEEIEQSIKDYIGQKHIENNMRVN